MEADGKKTGDVLFIFPWEECWGWEPTRKDRGQSLEMVFFLERKKEGDGSDRRHGSWNGGE